MECKRVGVSLKREFFEVRPSGVRKPQRAGDLVERFPAASSRVQRAGGMFRPVRRRRLAMPAGDDQAGKRRFQFGIGQIVRGNVRRNMVHAKKRKPCGVASLLRS